MKKLFLSLIVILLMCVSIAGCSTAPHDTPTNKDSITFVADYNSIYNALAAQTRYNYDVTISNPPTAIMTTDGTIKNTNADYSNTNVQVDGVDEGDIVKTNGMHIYSLQSGKLSIFRADGANTYLVSTTDIVNKAGANDSSYEYASEMYLCEDYIVIITQFTLFSYYNPLLIGTNNHICNVYVYDISEPTAPKLVHKLGQDGYILTSRLIGDTLYLLSNYYVYDFSENIPETFIPALYIDGTKTLIAPDCIAIMPYINSTAYTIVSAIDVKSGTVTANQTLLGGGGLVYMSAQNLYIANYQYNITESSRNYTSYTVTDYFHDTVTNITRLDISNSSVKVAAYGSVPGSLGNQFYMDEYAGYLRVVTTADSSKYSVYENAFGVYDYQWDNYTSSGLYILDMSLTIVGTVENLAPGERVYSVRFDSDIAYFVTFRIVDPLFAVDISNPQNPTVLSALKIPGFSQYLHIYSDDLLFGLGYNVDEESGIRGTVKLSMFNITDPKDVTEAHTLPISIDYSAALYNHKAILVDAEKSIICFPANSEYLVYGYDNQIGFYLRASINLDNDTLYNDSRGLYTSKFFYIVYDNGIAVIDMETFKLLATVNN